MTLHAKMEALRKLLSQPKAIYNATAILDQLLVTREASQALLAEWDRPASERAKEWRAEFVTSNPRRQHILMDEAEHAITHLGAAADQGELERLRKSAAGWEETARLHSKNADDWIVRYDEARRTIDTLLDRLAKGAG